MPGFLTSQENMGLSCEVSQWWKVSNTFLKNCVGQTKTVCVLKLLVSCTASDTPHSLTLVTALGSGHHDDPHATTKETGPERVTILYKATQQPCQVTLRPGVENKDRTRKYLKALTNVARTRAEICSSKRSVSPHFSVCLKSPSGPFL